MSSSTNKLSLDEAVQLAKSLNVPIREFPDGRVLFMIPNARPFMTSKSRSRTDHVPSSVAIPLHRLRREADRPSTIHDRSGRIVVTTHRYLPTPSQSPLAWAIAVADSLNIEHYDNGDRVNFVHPKTGRIVYTYKRFNSLSDQVVALLDDVILTNFSEELAVPPSLKDPVLLDDDESWTSISSVPKNPSPLPPPPPSPTPKVERVASPPAQAGVVTLPPTPLSVLLGGIQELRNVWSTRHPPAPLD